MPSNRNRPWRELAARRAARRRSGEAAPTSAPPLPLPPLVPPDDDREFVTWLPVPEPREFETEPA